MKILLYQWKAYNQSDIMQAFIRRGHAVEGFSMEMGNFESDDDFERELVKKLTQHDDGENSEISETLGDSEFLKAKDGRPAYDIVFSVNYFPLISDICERYAGYGLKYVCWTCDSPLSTMYHQSIFNSCNYIFIFDKFCYITFKEMGARVYYLPLAAATERVDEAIAECTADDTIRDVAFVGSMYRKNSYDEVKDMLPDYVRGYFDALMRMQMEIYGENYIDGMLTADIMDELNKHFNIEKSERSFSNLSLIFSTTVLGFKIAQMERMKLLGELSKHFDVSVYTDDEEADLILAHNMGPVHYWDESPVVFHTSRINLNLTIRNIRSGIPLRVWDILAAGGFCITNFQLELPLYFENGVDLVWFEDERDLIAKVKYYLEHEEERRRIACNGQQKVRKLHNYDVRLESMEKIIM
ncbi:MAG: DUF3880 domain-containing protein [Lachnospiraceae bacterium]